MKLRLLAALALLLPITAHAQGYGSGVDGQSVFRVSETRYLPYTGTASRTALIPSDARVYRIVTSSDAHKKDGNSSVVATTSDSLIPGFTPEYFKLPQTPSGTYISVVQDTAAGAAYIDIMKP
jgi:hypothetical protein